MEEENAELRIEVAQLQVGYVPTEGSFCGTGTLLGKSRVADPVHFWPDPDPAHRNFKTGSRILLALKESIQT